MPDEYVLIEGQYYKRVNAPPQVQFQQYDPNEVRDLGSLLGEAANQGRGKSLVSIAPSTLQAIQNPQGFQCPGCGHPVIEQGCLKHSDSEPYSWFGGFSPASYWHQKCLGDKLKERARQLQESYGQPQLDR